MAQDAESKTSATERAARAAHATVDRAAQAAESAEERLRRTGEDMHERAGDAVVQAERFVRERPVAALGIAFVAGIVISSWLRRS